MAGPAAGEDELSGAATPRSRAATDRRDGGLHRVSLLVSSPTMGPSMPRPSALLVVLPAAAGGVSAGRPRPRDLVRVQLDHRSIDVIGRADVARRFDMMVAVDALGV